MSNSWGREVNRLTEDQLALYARHDWTCAAGKCKEPPTHLTTYSYVTGRAGRVSFASRRACTAHAEAFAAKHGIEITDRAPAAHASETAVEQALGGQP